MSRNHPLFLLIILFRVDETGVPVSSLVHSRGTHTNTLSDETPLDLLKNFPETTRTKLGQTVRSRNSTL